MRFAGMEYQVAGREALVQQCLDACIQDRQAVQCVVLANIQVFNDGALVHGSNSRHGRVRLPGGWDCSVAAWRDLSIASDRASLRLGENHAPSGCGSWGKFSGAVPAAGNSAGATSARDKTTLDKPASAGLNWRTLRRTFMPHPDPTTLGPHHGGELPCRGGTVS